jgi:2-hydroxychromene-2-carboxylate isomerase
LKTIAYYFTHSSPWSFLGHARFLRIAAAHGVTVLPRPVDFGKIFPASGGLPLKQRPIQRQHYRLAELKRWRTHLNVPINLEPRFFPVDAKPADKLAVAAQAQGIERSFALSEALMRACWIEERNIADPATLAEIASACGYDGAALVALSQSDEAEKKYQTFNEEALSIEVFGAPTYALEGELFWGQDRLDFLERALSA